MFIDKRANGQTRFLSRSTNPFKCKKNLETIGKTNRYREKTGTQKTLACRFVFEEFRIVGFLADHDKWGAVKNSDARIMCCLFNKSGLFVAAPGPYPNQLFIFCQAHRRSDMSISHSRPPRIYQKVCPNFKISSLLPPRTKWLFSTTMKMRPSLIIERMKIIRGIFCSHERFWNFFWGKPRLTRRKS